MSAARGPGQLVPAAGAGEEDVVVVVVVMGVEGGYCRCPPPDNTVTGTKADVVA